MQFALIARTFRVFRSAPVVLPVLVTTFVVLLAACTSERKLEPVTYPEARMDSVVDDYHGTLVADPFRWLEDAESEETAAWVDAQNGITKSFLSTNSNREKLEKRLTDIWNYPKFGVPSERAGRYFFMKNDGLQNQSVLYQREGLAGESKIVIDPNTLSEDGTVALTNRAYSVDGTHLAYGTSGSGSDWQEIRIRNIDSGKDYDEVLKWCKFSSIAWRHDGKGFFYNRFPEQGSVSAEDRNNYNRVFWHEVGTAQERDVFVYGRDDRKELGFSPYITDDGDFLVLYVWHGTDPNNGISIRKTESEREFTHLFEVGEASYSPIGNVGNTFFFNTDKDAPRGRIVSLDIENRESWKEIIAESDDVISSAMIISNKLVVAYMRDAHHILKIHNLDGSPDKEIELPTIGAIRGISGKQQDNEMFFGFTSFLYPSTVFRYDLESGELTEYFESAMDFDASRYETRQVFYKSKDGTNIPMFITHRKGLDLDGSNPVLLYGYGGFNAGMTPHFSLTRLVWMEQGGVYAVACIRGGDEYGEDWHKAGMLENKQNVFDDFIAAAEWLRAKQYTSPEKLAIMGGSNGGLLVTACMLQRPDLFGAVVAAVPVTDMLRYHKFTVGRYWVPEYGNAEENPEHFNFLYAYSPLHTIRQDMDYPPILVTTADTDDRVVPAHAKKFVAALQTANPDGNPVLLRVETKAGHGGGKPTTKVIFEQSEIYAFLMKTLGMEFGS